MTVYRETINLATNGDQDMNDITDAIEKVVSNSALRTGICHIFNVGSTGVAGTIEFEPGLAEDLPTFLGSLIPPSRHYGHERTWHDGNGHSHLQATLMGPEITIPVENAALMRGTWQQIFHYEADIKARRREIIVTVIGE